MTYRQSGFISSDKFRTAAGLLFVAGGVGLLLPAPAAASGVGVSTDVPLYAATPFVLLLLSIAILPLVSPHWWERNYPRVAFSLGAVVVAYYVAVLGNLPRILLSAHEYLSFIVLIGSLFVVTGGILIRIEGRGTPAVNTALLAIGALISNVLGTTGASALLIRPFLRINQGRIRPYHVVFFIFVVSNTGGALTPIGDPPLFLGYLKGIPFFWVIGRVWYAWAAVTLALLAVFYGLERFSGGEPGRAGRSSRRVRVIGWASLPFIALVLVAVFLRSPWREILMGAATAAAYWRTPRRVLAENDFTFKPIQEVAIIFAGIFATMVPALDWLEHNASQLGVKTPGAFYWGTGTLSSFLDNAPTYLNFLTAAFGLFGLSVDNPAHMERFLVEQWRFVQAVSLGAVFFGACTYIGNGPNFMVKSIAEQAGIPTPSFFGYIFRFTLPVLVPIFTGVWLWLYW